MGSIRRTVVQRAALTTAATLCAAGLAVFLIVRALLYAEFDAGLATVGRALAALVERSPTGAPDIDLAAVAEVVPSGVRFSLWSADGTLLAGEEDLVPWSVLSTVGSSVGSRAALVQDQEDGRSLRGLAVRCRPRSGAQLNGYPIAVVLGEGHRIDHDLHRLALVLVGVLLVVTILGAVVQARALDLGLRPVTDLALEIDRLRVEDLRHRFAAVGRPAELAVVAERLDAMVGQLARALDRERRFGAAIAHELRTPLAGLTAVIEVGLLDPATPVEAHPRLEQCLGMCRQMAQLVESLLLLDRLSSGRQVPKRDAVDLDAVVRQVWSDVQRRAPGRTATFDLAPVQVAADRGLLVMVLANLMGNALDHGDPDAPVLLTCTDGGCVTVSNRGSRVSSADAPLVFDRFWRGDAARSGDLHCGLGLALCREAVTAMGGTIDAVSGDGTFQVRLTLPTALTELLPNVP